MRILHFRRPGGYFSHTIIYPPIYTSTPLANTLYALPFFCGPSQVFDRIATRVTTAKGGSLIRLGVYANLDSVHPGALLVDSGDLSAATTGAKQTVISFSSQAMKLHWLAYLSNNTPSVRGAIAADLTSSVFGQASDFGTVGHYFWSVSYSYGSLPDPFPSAIIGTLTYAPAVFLRKKPL